MQVAPLQSGSNGVGLAEGYGTYIYHWREKIYHSEGEMEKKFPILENFRSSGACAIVKPECV